LKVVERSAFCPASTHKYSPNPAKAANPMMAQIQMMHLVSVFSMKRNT